MPEQKVKQPVKTGTAKVPMIMQMEALECGAACLAMILAYYGKWIPLEQVRLDCGVSRDGSSMKNVYLAAQSYGLEVHGYRMEMEGINVALKSCRNRYTMRITRRMARIRVSMTLWMEA